MPQLPSFLRRRLLLHEARRALLTGQPEEALEHLEDACLALSEPADRLRARALDALCREAARDAAEGRSEAAERRLALVARREPDLAGIWRRRVANEVVGGAARRPTTAAAPRAETGVSALEELLAQMRGAREQVSGDAAPSGELAQERGATADAARRNGSRRRPARTAARAGKGESGPQALRFHLEVDDEGELLVVSGQELWIGHAHAGRADLPLCADLEPVHARLLREESFHGGTTWRIEAARGRSVRVDGAEIGEEAPALTHEALIELAPRLELRFRLPEPSSGSAVLELQHGLECEGAARVLLLAPGEAGRLRMGPRLQRHVPLRTVEHEVELLLQGGELLARSDSGLAVAGGAPGGARCLTLPCPPPERIHVAVGHGLAGRAPFGFSVRPVDAGGSRDGGTV